MVKKLLYPAECDHKVEKITLTHLVNPYRVPPESRAHFVQQVTFESMRRAREYAGGAVEVSFLTAQYPEDHAMLPEGFTPTPDLERSVLDVGAFQKPRKLPLARDLLQKLYDHSQGDYLAYTNVDIGLQPYFYLFVKALLDQGYDGIVINRRSISNHFTRLDELPEMYAEAGRPHRGWDCFIFQRTLFQKFILGDTCLGAPRVELGLYANLMAFCTKFTELKDAHATFHLGDDVDWRKGDVEDYADHNTRESLRALQALAAQGVVLPKGSAPERFLRMQRSQISAYLYDLLIKQINIPVETTRSLRHLADGLAFWRRKQR